MNENVDKKVYFAQTNFRNERTSFGIKEEDRLKHMYIIGKTGTGKTTLLENMAVQDIRNGEGVAVVDPHGSFAGKMLDYVPKERIKDVIYFDPSDMDCPIALNIMEDVDGGQRHLVASGLMGVFKKMWPDVWSARMEYILNNAILALLEYPDSTLLGVNRMLSDKEFRKKVVSNITDPVVKAFWEQEFAKYTERFAAESVPAIQNKVGQFTANPLIRNIIGQPKSSFDFRKAMDEKKIVIMNLSKGRIGELNANLLGAMLITKIYLAAMSRAKNPSEEWPNFYLYVDEFQNFAAESFTDILSESRKYGLALILAHQYIAQMPEGVSDAVFGNVGTHIVFRVGPADAEVLEVELAPEFVAEDIVNLGLAHIYLKLSIDGMPSLPFSAITLPPIEKSEESYRQEIVGSSRKNYCNLRTDVEKDITEWHAPVAPAPAKTPGKTPSVKEERSDGETPGVDASPPSLFEAECSVCGKKIVVPFQPDGKRPVFCPKHRSYLGEKSGVKIEKPDVETSDVNKETSDVKKTSGFGEENISLSRLSEKTHEFNRDRGFKKRKEKPAPDIRGLRELLKERTSDVETSDVNKETSDVKKTSDGGKILKPGDKIELD